MEHEPALARSATSQARIAHRLQRRHNGNVTTYRVNSRDQLCWEASGTPSGNCSSVPSGGVDYDYDDAGNMVNASGRHQLAHDERSRTSTITPSGKPAQTQTYAGEGQNERLTSGGTSFLHQQLGIGWANVTTVGTGDALAAGKTYFTRAPDGSLLSQRKPDGTTEYIILDWHPGSVVALVDASKTVATGMVKARYRYDPYGNVIYKAGSSDTPWRFAGAWFDRFPSSTASDQNGFYKMGERYYDPRNGRWSQRDALNQKSDLRESNRYAYAGSDPINRTDPSGLASLSLEGGRWNSGHRREHRRGSRSRHGLGCQRERRWRGRSRRIARALLRTRRSSVHGRRHIGQRMRVARADRPCRVLRGVGRGR